MWIDLKGRESYLALSDSQAFLFENSPSLHCYDFQAAMTSGADVVSSQELFP